MSDKQFGLLGEGLAETFLPLLHLHKCLPMLSRIDLTPICHICSTPIWTPQKCSACGHLVCQKCFCEVPEQDPGAHAKFSHHGKRTIPLEGPEFVPPSQIQRIASGERQVKPKWSGLLEGSNTIESSPDEHVPFYNSLERRHPPKALPETIPKFSIVRGNPFLAADRSTRDASDVSRNSEYADANARIQRSDHESEARETGGETPEKFTSGKFTWEPTSNAEYLAGVDAADNHSRGELDPVLSAVSVHQECEPSMGHVHRHHSAAFHGLHHITEHLTKAVGHGLQSYVRERARGPTKSGGEDKFQASAQPPQSFERPRLLDSQREMTHLLAQKVVFVTSPTSLAIARCRCKQRPRDLRSSQALRHLFFSSRGQHRTPLILMIIRSLRAQFSSGAARESVAITSTMMDAGPEGGDLGIEGVTIVMHIRGKEDIVINTDLG
ncbi:hypothetical protein Micbo1qcDRAFT_220913 [Microdochium bolleyi]|uniref:Uncharacterized protein n=1 Tax=Microdochium bolleyi TaxID=196109 RepID=A0A136JB17_9PEZI|nr:hypothetical protein Micbo1qcDRAFT_220913 [Microdochium bolleyi]